MTQPVQAMPDGWRPSARCLPDGKRWHLQQGPIDLIIEADGERSEVAASISQAIAAFDGVLEALVAELGELRRQLEPALALEAGPAPDVADSFGGENDLLPAWQVNGPVATRMCQTVAPFRHHFVTPMIAVAGAVADHVLAAMLDGRELRRAYVNNGGDIAVYLTEGQTFSIGVHGSDDRQSHHAARLQLLPEHAAGGIATSGWRGRSHSLGIADSVTVLAGNAAEADVAATLIANAVDLPGNDRVQRVPASELDEASDLGCRLVTVGVDVLSTAELDTALGAGAEEAKRLLGDGRIIACHLALQGGVRVVRGGAKHREHTFSPFPTT